MTQKSPLIEIKGVGKRYGGLAALTDVSFSVAPGEVHSLVGENGAGKSTMGKIMAGVVRPDDGEVLVDGTPQSFASPREALEKGIGRVDQELALVPTLTVSDNVLLGVEPRRGGIVLDRKSIAARFDRLIEISGFKLNPRALVEKLSIAEQQKIEILRAVAREVRLIVMDEPTSPLTPDESERMYQLVRTLRDDGMAIVYVSHFLEEVLDLSDTITILRDGRHVRTRQASEETRESLVNGMIGRDLESLFPERVPVPEGSPVVFRAKGIAARRVKDVELEVRAGEIVGLFGLVGAGRSELARAIFGADPKEAGTLEVDGREVKVRNPHQAIEAGIAMLPEDRKGQGLCLDRSIEENLTLAHLGEVARMTVIRRGAQRRRVDELMAELGVRARDSKAAVTTLSGGNQQKVLFGKWLFDTPSFLITDEPTRGVDVGAKRSIHELLVNLAKQGKGILLISSELEEILGVAHRVLVMCEGQIVAATEQASTDNEEEILAAAFGER
jgi:rhamnose transport system ATP-binding protein